MKRPATRCFVLLVFYLVLAGCASTGGQRSLALADGARPLRTFEIQPAETSGFEWSDANARLVDQVSSQVLEARLLAKGYALARVGEAPDFSVTPKWRKYAGHGRTVFSSGGAVGGAKAKQRPAGRFAVQYALDLQFFEESSGDVIWRSQQRRAFEGLRFSEENVARTLEKALRDFPEAE